MSLVLYAVSARFSDSVSRGVQADGKDDYSAVLDTDLHTASAVNMLGAAPLAPTLLRIRGDDQPFQVPPPPAAAARPAWFLHRDAVNCDWTGSKPHAVFPEGAAHPARRLGLQPNHGHLSRYGVSCCAHTPWRKRVE